MIEPSWLAAIGTCTVAFLALGAFWFNSGTRIAKVEEKIKAAEATAKVALQSAAEADRDLRDLEKRFADYREAAIEKFVMTDTLDALKADLVDAQARSEERLIYAVKGISDRLDKLFEARMHEPRTKG